MTDFSSKSMRPLVTACILFTLVLLYSWNSLFFVKIPKDQMWDRHQYLTMAEGHAELVVKPFSKRILHPVLTGFLSRVLTEPVQKSFLQLAFALLALLIGGSTIVIQRVSGHSLIAFPLLLCPYVSLIFSDYLMHDLLFSALAVLFFMTLMMRRPLLALLFLFLLFLTREATLLLAVVLVGVAITKRRFLFAAGVASVAAAGLFIISKASGQGPSNIHGLGEAFFMLGKFVYNGSSNFLGVNLWANTYHSCDPVVVRDVPSWIPAGLITQVGVCNFDFLQPVHTFGRFLTIFGIGPGLVAVVLLKRGRTLLGGSEFWLLACLSFGVISFLLGPFLGPSGYRLMGYGSPAFFLAVPALLKPHFNFRKREVICLLIVHLVLTWLPILTTDFRHQSLLLGPIPEKIVLLSTGAIGQLVGIRVFLKSLVSHSTGSPVQFPT